MHQTRIDAQVLAQFELEQSINKQAATLAPFEIDAVHDNDFGTLYRLWQGWNLLGTFYLSNVDGKWVAQSSFSTACSCCDNSEQAVLLIIAVSWLLIADAA
jgi:hypothetical protein